QKRGPGWMLDDQRPTLTLTYPRAGVNKPLTRILVGMHDYYTGLDMDSFQVVADFPLDGVAAGDTLAKKFKPKSDGVWELRLAAPVRNLPKGKLTVSIKDRQGNITRMERTFSVAAEDKGKKPPPGAPEKKPDAKKPAPKGDRRGNTLTITEGDLKGTFRDNTPFKGVLSGVASLSHQKDAPKSTAFANAGLDFEHIISGHTNP